MMKHLEMNIKSKTYYAGQHAPHFLLPNTQKNENNPLAELL